MRIRFSSCPAFALSWRLLQLPAGVCFLLTAGLIQAQAQSSLSGVVKDPSGAVVSRVMVTLTSQTDASTRRAVANDDGAYVFSSVPPGSYKLTTEAPGFANAEKTVALTAGETATLDLALAVAQNQGAVSVEAKSDPFNVVPNAPSGSLFGFEKSIEDTPRSISVADSETLTRYAVRTVNDLVTVAPGTFTGSYFGIPGSVFIRGDIGDNFFRGFRRVENRGNYQTPVAATDHIEIVKGPPSPIYGGGRVGGFMNFMPKTTRSESAKWLENATGKVTLTYGSYDQKVGGAELGMPFKAGSHRAGFYAYFETEDSHSFYKGVANRYKLGQIAFDMELSPKVRLQYGFQGYTNSGTQNIGWNRVTQDLVDNQMYLSGKPLVNLSTNGYNIGPANMPANILSTFAFQKDMSGPFLSDPSVARLYALDPASIKLVKLPLDRIMIDAGDFTATNTFTGYFDIVYDIKPGLTFKNQSFFDGMNHQKYSSYGFGAGYRPWTIENKSTLAFDWKPGKFVVMHAIAGFGYRRVKVSAGEERNWYQTVDRRDLSVGATPNDRFQGPFNSGGNVFFQYFQKGSYGNPGAYWLSDFLFWNKLTATVGVRFDRYTPDFMGRFNGEPMTPGKASSNAATYNASVSYKLPFHMQPYFTAATSRFLDLGQGNELDAGQVRDGTYLQNSTLYEGGVKTSGLTQKVFASLAVFRQKRAAYNNLTREPDYYLTKGVEVEARAFVAKRVSLTGALTWQDPQQLNVPFLLGIPPTLLGITQQQGYAGRFIGLANIFGLKAPYGVGGQPHWVGSPFATVNVTKYAGFTVGTSLVSSVKTGYVSDVKLPAYGLWRGSVFFEHKHYHVNLAINNMFDKTYYQSQFLFWDVFIKPGALRTLTLTTSYSF
jgi:iron complex outermembrane receptor protein